MRISLVLSTKEVLLIGTLVMNQSVARGRLAPSPTGGLHVGHARTFLVAWLSSRSLGGQLVLRIEDIDSGRVRADAIDNAYRDLEWLGLDYDLGPYVQSQRMNAYSDMIDQLKRKELVFPCTCTRSDILRAASAPHTGEDGPAYPGTCAMRSASEGEQMQRSGKTFAWRFRAGQSALAWEDTMKGSMSVLPGGDFVVARSPFVPSYQLAVVCDDAAMGITQVIRGDDLVPSTPRQLLLYQAIGASAPSFGHLPLVHDHNGRRLAKRDGAIKLSALRQAGMSAEWLIGYLAYSCGWSKEVEPSRPHSWLERASHDQIPKQPWRLSPPIWPNLIDV